MTSLIRQVWLLPAAGAVAALAVPLWVLWPVDETPIVPVSPVPYALDMPRSPGTGRAIMAMPFSPGRDPAFAGKGAAAASPADAPAASPPELVGLIGRVKGPGIALVRTADGTTSVVSRGQDVAGWSVTAIGRDSITFTSGGNTQVMRLNYGNRDAAQADSPAGQQP